MAMMALLTMSCSNEATEIQAQTTGEAKSLVVYYSYTGNSRQIVESLQSQISCDVVEVTPAEKGLNYEANNYAIGSALISAIRNNPGSESSYPGIDDLSVDFTKYSTIIIACPLWWSQMGAPMQTFLFKNGAQMAGKNIALIVSSASSGISGVESDAKRLVPDGKFAKSLWINSDNHAGRASLISTWLNEINYNSLVAESSNAMKMNLTIGGVTHTATLVENTSTQALVAQLQKGSITYEAHDYGNFEKVGALGFSFPENNENITTEPGDLILYLGSNLCIYYDSNNWDFTRIGKLDNMTQAEIKSWVNAGGSNVSVTLSYGGASGINSIAAEKSSAAKSYNLSGQQATVADRIVIKKGKKTIR